MNDETNRDEWIEQYLLGKLEGNELSAFTQKLAADEAFKKEVDLQRAIVRNIKAVGRNQWAQKLEAYHHEIDESEPLQTQPGTAKVFKGFFARRYAVMSAAAVLFILLVAAPFVLRKGSDNDELFTAYYKPYGSIEQNTRSLPTNASERSGAFKAYEAGNYTRSVELFKNLLAKGEDEVVLFYLGNAYLSARRPADAERTFADYLKRYKEFVPEATWYLSLSYIKQKRTKEAVPLLQNLMKQAGPFRKEADELLQKLQNQ